MDKEEKSLVTRIAILSFVFGIIGACIGGFCTFYGSYWSWNQQQKVLEDQKSSELHNIAVALCFDVAKIENDLNITMKDFLISYNNSNVLNDPNFIYFTDTKYYSISWVYNVFGKDFSRFDGITSADLYAFYEGIAENNDKSQFVYQIGERIARGEKVSPWEIAAAHTYTKGLFGERIPDSILLAEKIKRELTEKYHTNIHLSPISPLPRTYMNYQMELNHTTNSSKFAINFY